MKNIINVLTKPLWTNCARPELMKVSTRKLEAFSYVGLVICKGPFNQIMLNRVIYLNQFCHIGIPINQNLSIVKAFAHYKKLVFIVHKLLEPSREKRDFVACKKQRHRSACASVHIRGSARNKFHTSNPSIPSLTLYQLSH